MKRFIRLAVAFALLIVGIGCVGLRTFEYLAGGFVGEARIMGMHVIVVDLPLVPVGIVAIIVGSLLLWQRPHR